MSEILTLVLLMTDSLVSAASLKFCFVADSNQLSLLYLPAASSPAKYLQEVTDSFVLQHIIGEVQVRIDSISESSAFSDLGNVAISFEVGDYLVYRLLSNAYCQRNFPNSNPWLLSYLAKHQSMICNKLPSRHTHTAFPKLGSVILQKFLFKISFAKARTS